MTSATDFTIGYTIKYIKEASGNPLKVLVNNTMMKVLGSSISFLLARSYLITDRSSYLFSCEGLVDFPSDNNAISFTAWGFLEWLYIHIEGRIPLKILF